MWLSFEKHKWPRNDSLANAMEIAVEDIEKENINSSTSPTWVRKANLFLNVSTCKRTYYSSPKTNLQGGAGRANERNREQEDVSIRRDCTQ